jgi:hypothetical protein
VTVSHAAGDIPIVAAQMGRAPRDPWRVGARCAFGYPQALISPAVLDDGSRFPNLAWLTCPFLNEKASADESAGATSRWASRASTEPDLALRLRALDAAVRAARLIESGDDPCADVGVAGQADPLGVKCLHAHLALSLCGFDDPIGAELLGAWGGVCSDGRCARIATGEMS